MQINKFISFWLILAISIFAQTQSNSPYGIYGELPKQMLQSVIDDDVNSTLNLNGYNELPLRSDHFPDRSDFLRFGHFEKSQTYKDLAKVDFGFEPTFKELFKKWQKHPDFKTDAVKSQAMIQELKTKIASLKISEVALSAFSNIWGTSNGVSADQRYSEIIAELEAKVDALESQSVTQGMFSFSDDPDVLFYWNPTANVEPLPTPPVVQGYKIVNRIQKAEADGVIFEVIVQELVEDPDWEGERSPPPPWSWKGIVRVTLKTVGGAVIGCGVGFVAGGPGGCVVGAVVGGVGGLLYGLGGEYVDSETAKSLEPWLVEIDPSLSRQEILQQVMDIEKASVIDNLSKHYNYWENQIKGGRDIIIEIGNEPNYFPYISPKLYAWYYAKWIETIVEEIDDKITIETNAGNISEANKFILIKNRLKFMPGGLLQMNFPSAAYAAFDLIGWKYEKNPISFFNNFQTELIHLANIRGVNYSIDYGNLHFYPYTSLSTFDGDFQFFGKNQFKMIKENLTTLKSKVTTGKNLITELGFITPDRNSSQENSDINKILDEMETLADDEYASTGLVRWYWFKHDGEDPKFQIDQEVKSDAETVFADFLTAIGSDYSDVDISELNSLIREFKENPPRQGIVSTASTPNQIRPFGEIYIKRAMNYTSKNSLIQRSLFRINGEVISLSSCTESDCPADKVLKQNTTSWWHKINSTEFSLAEGIALDYLDVNAKVTSSASYYNLQFFINVPSLGLYNEWIGMVEYRQNQLSKYSNHQLNLPTYIKNNMIKGANDIQISVVGSGIPNSEFSIGSLDLGPFEDSFYGNKSTDNLGKNHFLSTSDQIFEVSITNGNTISIDYTNRPFWAHRIAFQIESTQSPLKGVITSSNGVRNVLENWSTTLRFDVNDNSQANFEWGSSETQTVKLRWWFEN